MGTKANPGKFDCAEKAKAHEPRFTLLGRDPFAGPLVRMWAAFRESNVGMAARAFAELCEMSFNPDVQDKIDEAVRCANGMEAYASRRPFCHICFCTEENACDLGLEACSWANKEQTVCSNPRCVEAAGLAPRRARGAKR